MNAEVTIKKNHEFRRIYRKGVSVVGSGMVIYCMKNHSGRNRLGVTASVKIGSAVVRNRARRRLRELYRLQSGCLRPGHDILLVARRRTAEMSWTDLNGVFLRLCRKLDLLEEQPES